MTYDGGGTGSLRIATWHDDGPEPSMLDCGDVGGFLTVWRTRPRSQKMLLCLAGEAVRRPTRWEYEVSTVLATRSAASLTNPLFVGEPMPDELDSGLVALKPSLDLSRTLKALPVIRRRGPSPEAVSAAREARVSRAAWGLRQARPWPPSPGILRASLPEKLLDMHAWHVTGKRFGSRKALEACGIHTVKDLVFVTEREFRANFPRWVPYIGGVRARAEELAAEIEARSRRLAEAAAAKEARDKALAGLKARAAAAKARDEALKAELTRKEREKAKRLRRRVRKTEMARKAREDAREAERIRKAASAAEAAAGRELRARYEADVGGLIGMVRQRSVRAPVGMECPLRDEIECSLGILDERSLDLFNRLIGWDGTPPASVSRIATDMGVTGARIYQLAVRMRGRLNAESGWPDALATEARGLGGEAALRLSGRWWSDGLSPGQMKKLVRFALRGLGEWDNLVHRAEAAALTMPADATAWDVAWVALSTLGEDAGELGPELLAAMGLDEKGGGMPPGD